jgi:hypothetical protein
MKLVFLISVTFMHFGILAQNDTLIIKPPQLKIPIDSVLIKDKIIEFGGPEASFPGGNDSLRIYIQENFLCFPDSATGVTNEKIMIRLL